VERQERLALAVHQLCRSDGWRAVEGVITGYLGTVTAELIGYVPRSLDDPQPLRLQARAKAVTDVYNEFARLDALAVQIETMKGERDE
jgi:hypothetical protein